MPLNNATPYADTRREFCLALTAARERSGVTLAHIAEVTKVPSSLFAALERGDLRHWPKGLFRRAFFRGYAELIGMPVAETCAEFVRWFPDDERARVVLPDGGTDDGQPAPRVEEVRLTFDPAWHGPGLPLLSRLVTVVVDAAAVMLNAATVSWAAGISWLSATAVVALMYFSLATLVGQSPARLAFSWRHSIFEGLMHGGAAIGAAFRSAYGPVREPAGDQPHPPPLRVRIKVS